MRSAAALRLLFCSAAVTVPSVQGLAGSTSTCRDFQRRSFLRHAAAIATSCWLSCASLVKISPAHAEEGVSTLVGRGKPYAPVETLLPATRLKVWVDEAYALSTTLTGTQDKNEQYQTLRRMNQILSKDPKLFPSGRPKQRTRRSTAQLSTGVSSANREQYRAVRSDLSIPDKMTAMLNQADVERQWGMLRYAESKREESNDMRAAFNYYVQSLVFGDTYQLTASKEDRKRMIRNDELPSLTAVIVSDLDLRDLHRNQFLTSIDDARAEVAYQVRQSPDEIDCTEAITLIGDAHSSMKKWFDLISPADVDEALKVLGSSS